MFSSVNGIDSKKAIAKQMPSTYRQRPIILLLLSYRMEWS